MPISENIVHTHTHCTRSERDLNEKSEVRVQLGVALLFFIVAK